MQQFIDLVFIHQPSFVNLCADVVYDLWLVDCRLKNYWLLVLQWETKIVKL